VSITGLDHVLVGVANLEAARESWARLGFTVTPRGRHIGWGTANYCIMLENDYVELLGIVDPSQFVNRLDEFLASEGEGLLGLAFAADEAEAVHAGLKARGIAVEAPKELKRLLELPGGDVTPEFALVHIDREDAAGIRAFVCTHLTRDMVWQPQWTRHANGAEAIDAVTLSVADPGATAARFGRLFDTKPEPAGDVIRVRTAPDACLLEIVAGPSASPVLAGMTVRVPDLDLPARHFARNGIFFTRDTFTVSVEKEDATGTDLVFALGEA
jgi:catechol 2,3-dioxygenase-like lactoylglutathione lyase family enzyme